MMVTSRMFIYLVVFVVSSITSVKISAVVFDVVRREEPLRNVQVELEIQSIFAVIGKAVESGTGEFGRDVPQFVDGDVLVFINDTVIVLVGVPPVELEELHEFVRDVISFHLLADVHAPLDELVHGDGAIAVLVRRFHQEGERLLLTRVSVIVEFVARLDGGGASELLDDRFVVLEVDHSVAVNIVSVSEEELQLLPEEVTHGSCLCRLESENQQRNPNSKAKRKRLLRTTFSILISFEKVET